MKDQWQVTPNLFRSMIDEISPTQRRKWISVGVCFWEAGVYGEPEGIISFSLQLASVRFRACSFFMMLRI